MKVMTMIVIVLVDDDGFVVKEASQGRESAAASEIAPEQAASMEGVTNAATESGASQRGQIRGKFLKQTPLPHPGAGGSANP